MDINFKCPHCEQELSADASGTGSEIQCPACGQSFVIPQAAATATVPQVSTRHEPHIVNPIASSAAAKEDRHFSVPQREKPSNDLIEKPNKPLEDAAKEGVHLRVKCIRHSDCVEVGRDHFDEMVTTFLNKVGEPNIVKLDTFNYAHRDLETREWVTDYGVLILYKG